MSLFETKAEMVCKFHRTATAAALLEHMNPEKREHVETFVAAYEQWKKGDDPMEVYRLKVAPLQKIFDRTHTLVGVAVSILEGWSSDAGNREEVEAETGAWKVGADEAQDLTRLQKLQAGFVKFFGTEGLPPGLRKGALDKQVKAHEKARAEMPTGTPSDVQKSSRTAHRTLTDACDLAFDDYHDFLDGWFGTKGKDVFKKKEPFGYNRRAGYYHSSSSTEPGTGDGNSTGSGDKSGTDQPSSGDAGGSGSGQPAAPRNVSPGTNPVATGAGRGQPPGDGGSADERTTSTEPRK